MTPHRLLCAAWTALASLALLASAASSAQSGSPKRPHHKLDCYPIDGANQSACEALGCIWQPVGARHAPAARSLGPQALADTDELKSRVDEPWCYFPANYTRGYQVVKAERVGEAAQLVELRRVGPSALGADSSRVRVKVEPLWGGQVLRVHVSDALEARYEPELPRLNLERAESKESNGAKLTFKFRSPEPDGFASQLEVRRSDTHALLFSTDLRRLIFSRHFMQLNTKLNTANLFGLGEHYDNFHKRADRFKTYSFWNTDRLASPGGQRSYGGFPFYVNLDEPEKVAENGSSFSAHGVYLRNSNAMDVVLQSDQSLTLRPLGGTLDFYLLAGPEPLEVARQFQQLVGLPALPPRWALGFHLCRYNYGSLAETKLVWQRTRDASIPFDVQWNDIDYMHDYNDFSYDPQRYAGLAEFVRQLHAEHHMRYVPIFDPGLSQQANYKPYELGEQLDVWIKNSSGLPLVGRVWNSSNRTVFADFSAPNKSASFWAQLFGDFRRQLDFDGAWLDMNDISNFVDGSLDGCPSWQPIERPPYLPGGQALQHKSLCLSARHSGGRLEYDMHNLYSFYESIATKRALELSRPNERTLIISRSTHPGQGHYSGHWSGDVLSDWRYLRWSVPSLLEHSLYGFSMMGTDICGFSGNTTLELCARWSTLGAFYTFSRNHNDDTSIDQDPVAMGQQVIRANRNAFTKKYSLLPYLYTLIFEASLEGLPVARSLSFQFFHHHQRELNQLLQLETQFMLGPALLVAPIVEPASTRLRAYLPQGRWYQTDILPESASQAPKRVQSLGGWHSVDQVQLDNLVLFLRGGHVLPIYSRVEPTTQQTAQGQPISLQVALCDQGRARGRLLIDDGQSSELRYNEARMEANNKRLEISLLRDHYNKTLEFGLVQIYGVAERVSQVKLSAPEQQRQVDFKQIEHMLVFDLGPTPVDRSGPLLVEWI